MRDVPVRRRVAGALLLLAASALLFLPGVSAAQPVEPPNGPRSVDPGWHAITGARIVAAPGRVIESGTIIVRRGRIEAVGANVAPPAGARVWNATGLTIYPGLIEPYLEVDAPAPASGAPHWNRHIVPQRNALDGDGVPASVREARRKMGYVLAHVAPSDGILRGTTAIVSLAEPNGDAAHVKATDVMQAASLGRQRGGYPGSKMGVIALLRQTLADADWYGEVRAAHGRAAHRYDPPAANDAFASLDRAHGGAAPLLFVLDDELDTLRAHAIAAEFERTDGMAIVGAGTDFRRLAAIAALGVPIVSPLDFPAKPDVASIAERERVSLRELMTWEQAPTNVRRLSEAGVDVSITASRLGRGASFAKHLRRAMEHGLAFDDALAMLTTRPAALLGVDDSYGTIDVGKSASFVVVDGELFGEKTIVREVWIDGGRHPVDPRPRYELDGVYDVTSSHDGTPAVLTIAKGKVSLEVDPAHLPAAGEDKAPADAGDDEDAPMRTIPVRGTRVVENRIGFLTSAAPFGGTGTMTHAALVEADGRIFGVTLFDGDRVEWSGDRRPDETVASADADDDGASDANGATDVPDALPVPFGAYGLLKLPEVQDLLLTNATLWTCGPAGIVESGWMLVRGGRIEGIGSGDPPGARGVTRLDLGGRHVTPGLIDCHSHTGISGGVNEGTQAVTAEVRIGDVVDPDAIGWYRELAGGLTLVNQLHGSANPIGGQNSVVKIRWGVAHPDEMRVEGAPGGIKFALGENVKQSNWGDDATTRYPQTRMGVETIIRDRFQAAREYERLHASDGDVGGGRRTVPRRDLELEALAEILAGDRLVHCHSYRQDEILMLCRVAADFGFRIGTFQHVLEGYKVAEAIREHAIGGSSFSDWWAYKFEVFDAIPSNGAIMHEAGVVVSFNSDSDELARRMNAEAAKAVKYGGVDPHEALKFVTLNPAIQLGIEDRVGSLEAGKDADFVIWSGDPLSTFSRCERTFIDGREHFSLARDAELRAMAAAERERIIEKLVRDPKQTVAEATGAGGGEPEMPEMIDAPPTSGALIDPEAIVRAHRERTLLDQLEAEYFYLLRNGFDPHLGRQGDCGCGLHALFGSVRR